MCLGALTKRLRGSERIVVENAARNVLYRGWAGNFWTAKIDRKRKVDSVSIGVETYRKTDELWDWENTKSLPEEVPMEQISKFDIGELSQILYLKIRLKSDFE